MTAFIVRTVAKTRHSFILRVRHWIKARVGYVWNADCS